MAVRAFFDCHWAGSSFMSINRALSFVPLKHLTFVSTLKNLLNSWCRSSNNLLGIFNTHYTDSRNVNCSFIKESLIKNKWKYANFEQKVINTIIKLEWCAKSLTESVKSQWKYRHFKRSELSSEKSFPSSIFPCPEESGFEVNVKLKKYPKQAMDTDMEYLPINIKQEVEPPTSASNENSSSNNNNNQAAPDSVENKVRGNRWWRVIEKAAWEKLLTPLPSCVD